jgi:hypothetical protein
VGSNSKHWNNRLWRLIGAFYLRFRIVRPRNLRDNCIENFHPQPSTILHSHMGLGRMDSPLENKRTDEWTLVFVIKEALGWSSHHS